MALIKLSKEMEEFLAQRTSALLSTTAILKEFGEKVNLLNIQPINNYGYFLRELNIVNIDFRKFDKTINSLNKEFKAIFQNDEYRELIRKVAEEQEKDFNQWKERKKLEFEEMFASLKNYINKNEMNPPRNFIEFYEFWAGDLPKAIDSFATEISEEDFIKFHYYKEENLIKTKKGVEKELLLMKLGDELSQKSTITEKLNCWLEIQNNKLKNLDRDDLEEIIEVIIKNHIEPICNKIEYGLWQLGHLSNKKFNEIYETQRIENELTSKDAIGNIKARLSQIDLEEKVYKDYRANNKNFDYTKSYKHDAIYFDSDEKIEKSLHYIIEYFRVINDFYSTTLFTNNSEHGKAPLVYAKHILLKNFLETKLKELELPAPPKSPKIGAGKKPKAKVLMAFIELINKQIEIIPKPSEYRNNDEKFTIIADKIRVKFNYDFSGKTLEKEQYQQEGFSLEVYNLLIEWEYNTIATKYKAYNNK
jgi:hypothetical protein